MVAATGQGLAAERQDILAGLLHVTDRLESWVEGSEAVSAELQPRPPRRAEGVALEGVHRSRRFKAEVMMLDEDVKAGMRSFFRSKRTGARR